MRILEITSGGAPNGAVLQCQDLIREFVKRGHDVTLLCPRRSWIANRLAREPVEIVESGLQRWPLAELRRIASLIESRGIQITHTHMSRAHAFGILLRWFSRTPCVATAHSRQHQLHWPLNDYVIANSNVTLRFHRRWNFVSARRSEFVPCLVDVNRFETVSDTAARDARKRLGVTDQTLLFGIVGDVCRRKGQIYLVRALPRILSSVPNARLVIIGNTLDPQYKARIRDESEHLGVSDAVVWRPFEGNIAGLMRTLDVCVNASLEESLGLTIPEAMAAGRAVVASNVGGIPENVVHGETGLLVRPARPRAFAEAISELLADPERRARMGQAARQRVRTLYNTERSVSRIEEIFADVIERGL